MPRRKKTSPPAFFSKQVLRSRLFHRIPSSRTASAFSVFCGGSEHCASDYRINRSTFPYLCVELVWQGQGQLFLPGKEPEPLRPGTLFTYGPGIAYRMESDTRQPLVKYFIDFSGSQALHLLEELGFPPGSVSQVFPLGPLVETLNQLIDAGLSYSPRARQQEALLLELFLLRCADSRTSDKSDVSRAFATFDVCRHRLEQAVPLLTNVQEAAELNHIDPAYLCRLFKRFAHCSPHQYLTRLRLHAATQQMLQSRCLVKEVADEFGFSDAYHFSRVFKKFNGISPEEFIRRRRS